MNPLGQFKQVISDLKMKIRNKFTKTLGIKTIGEYKLEIKEMLDDLKIIADYDVIDELIAQKGISGTAQEYINVNKFYKEYYKFILKEIQKAENVSAEFKAYAKAAEKEYEETYKEIIQYLYDKKQQALYGVQEDVHTYHANSFADEPLPWLRKEELNEDKYNNDFYENFNEGLTGLSLGGTAGAVIAIVISSLSASFHIHPKLFTGISTALGAIVGHFIQKHFFIDFTNYVKLKRYVTYYPESFEMICDIMAKNAVKFQQKDPIKYKKILMNLKRLQQNPPEIYKNYLDDEIEAENNSLDSNIFDIKNAEGNTIVNAQLDSFSSGSNYSSGGSIRRSRARDRLARRRDYTVSGSSNELSIQAKDILGEI